MDGKKKMYNFDVINNKAQSALHKLLAKDRPRISVGLATCGISVGGEAVFEKFKEEIQNRNLDVDLAKTGCIGFCKEEPIVNIKLPGKAILVLHKITPSDVDKILDSLDMYDLN